MAVFCSVLLPASAAGSADAVEWGRDCKKVIACGWRWGSLTPELLLRHADKIDATGIDGISLYIAATDKTGRRVTTEFVMDGAEWTRDMVREQIPALREATRHPGLRECFIRTIGAPKKTVDWSDDAAWARIVESMSVIAWFARETGVRGFIVDPEDYYKTHQFMRQPGERSYEELAPLARRRAREVFARVFAEHPSAVVLGYWMLSWYPHRIASENPMASARDAGDLWPAFVNGILDAMPPTARLVDGNEWAYEAEASANEFMASAIAQRNAADGLVAPENRLKFRGQCLPGFGVYLDMYVNDRTNRNGKANHYYSGPENGSRLGHFQRNLAEALECSGGYVWLWCEEYPWIDPGADWPKPWGKCRDTWETKLPGLSRSIRVCSDSRKFFKTDFPALKAAGRLVNVLAGEDPVRLSKEAVDGPEGKVDEREKGKGYFCLGDPKARPGEYYVAAVETLGEGIEVIAMWQNRKTGWWRFRLPGHNVALLPYENGKRRGAAVIRVPEGADCLMFQFLFKPEPGKPCRVEKVFLAKIPIADNQK